MVYEKQMLEMLLLPDESGIISMTLIGVEKNRNCHRMFNFSLIE